MTAEHFPTLYMLLIKLDKLEDCSNCFLAASVSSSSHTKSANVTQFSF